MSKTKIGLVILISLAFVQLAWLSVARYEGYNLETFDLSNISQSVWSVQNGKPLVFTGEGFEWSRLSIHMELFYFLLVPLYMLFSSPKTLLIFQAGLFAIGAWPVFSLARRRLNDERIALLMAAVYLLYPVGQTAVLFEFHGDTIGMPLMMFAINAADQQSWRRYAFWLVLAVSAKFYAALPAAALGVVLWLKGDRKAGAVTAVCSLAWGALAFFVFRDLFSPTEITGVRTTGGGYFTFLFGQFEQIIPTVQIRLANALVVFMPAVFLLGWRAPTWLLAAGAIAGPVLLTSGPGPTYDFRFHHYALAVPFLVAGAVYGAERLKKQAGRERENRKNRWRSYSWLTFMTTLVFSMLLVDTFLSPLFYVRIPGVARGFDASAYGVTIRDNFKDEWLAENVPDDAAVGVDNLLGTRLTNRSLLYRTSLQFLTFDKLVPDLDFVVVDSLFDYAHVVPRVTHEYETIRFLLLDRQMGVVAAQDGLLLFGRQEPFLNQSVESADLAEAPEPLAVFDERIALLNFDIIQIEDDRFSMEFSWLPLSLGENNRQLIAVSRLDGVNHSRIVHLPTATLRPTTSWLSGEVITEQIEFTVPDDLPVGDYEIYVGWYDTTDLYAAETDERSRVGEEYPVYCLSVP